MPNNEGDSEAFYDEIEIEDFELDEEREMYHYPCPCGDRLEITLKALELGEDVATCPSCSLFIRVIYDLEQFVKLETLSLGGPVSQSIMATT